MNLERKIKDLEKKWFESTTERWDYSENELEIPEALARELEEEKPLREHLGEKHLYPIFRWKLDPGLEKIKPPGPGYFVNYGEDFQNPTIEEWEFFRVEKKWDQAHGYDPKKDPNYQF